MFTTYVEDNYEQIKLLLRWIYFNHTMNIPLIDNPCPLWIDQIECDYIMDCEIDYGDCDADDKPQKRFVFKKKKKAITKDGK